MDKNCLRNVNAFRNIHTVDDRHCHHEHSVVSDEVKHYNIISNSFFDNDLDNFVYNPDLPSTSSECEHIVLDTADLRPCHPPGCED